MPENQIAKSLRAAAKHIGSDVPPIAANVDTIQLTGRNARADSLDVIEPWQPDKDVPIHLIGEGVTQLNKACESMLRQWKLSELVDMRFFRQHCEDLVYWVYRQSPTPQAIEQVLHNLHERIDASIVHMVGFVGVANAGVGPADQVAIGPVRFLTLADALVECQKQHRFPGNDEVHHLALRRLQECDVVARIQFCCHSSMASVFCIERLDEVLSLLRCCTKVSHPPGFRDYVARRGQIPPHSADVRLIFRRDHPEHWTIHSSAVGARLPCHIPELPQLDSVQAVFSELLAKPPCERSDLERQVALALRWSGALVRDDESHLDYLNQCIALESLLSDRANEVTRTISENLALMIANNVDSALSVENKMKHLYDVRSRIVHDGRTDVMEEDLLTITRYVLYLLVEIAGRCREWSSRNSMLEWIRRSKYLSCEQGRDGSAEDEQ